MELTANKMDKNNRKIMEKIAFTKMSGCGNDFIVIDNRKGRIQSSDQSHFVKRVSRRRMSVGADGVILIENSDRVDFKWRFYNSDGSQAEMCGNGARCAARFAFLNSIAPQNMSFETVSGVISAAVETDSVRIRMTDPSGVEADIAVDLKEGPLQVDSIFTGVPHVVVAVEDAEKVDVAVMGREIRYHQRFQPAGTNVNFVSRKPDGTIRVRTYERGVEDETLACGTGAVAAAIVASQRYDLKSPVEVVTSSGGVLTIFYTQDGPDFREVYLQGDARVVYEGTLWEETLV